MHAGSGTQWAADEDWGSPLAHHLVVRDMLGADEFDGLGLPRTGASVPQIEAIPRRLARSLADQWQQWWSRGVADAPGPVSADLRAGDGPSMPQGGELRAFVLPRWSSVCAAAAAINERARSAMPSPPADLAITEAMAEISRQLDRPANPFRLSIEVVPLADPGLWRVAPTRLLVSTALRLQPARFRSAIAPILRDLA